MYGMNLLINAQNTFLNEFRPFFRSIEVTRPYTVKDLSTGATVDMVRKKAEHKITIYVYNVR